MKDNMCEEIVIKINWDKDTYYDDNDIRKFKDTNLPLGGKHENEDGSIFHFKNGKLHNENGPAYITKTGYKDYRINGKRHRIDGPAIIYPDPEVYSWYVNGYRINSETIWNWLTENNIPLDYKTWSNEDKMLFALHWSDYNGQY